MVEQENSKASLALPYSQDSSARFEPDISNPWFTVDSTTLSNERPLYVSNASVEDNYSYIMQNNLSKEVCNSSLEKHSKEQAFTKLEEWSQPLSDMFPATYDPYFEVNSPLSFWSTCPLDLDTMKMDDVFQVDKDDLVQSPTLAELNANDESLFDSFDCFDGFLPNGDKTLNKQFLMPDLNPDFNIAFNNANNPKKIFSCSASSVSAKEQVLPQKQKSLKRPSSYHFSKEFIKPKPQTSLQDKVHTVPASNDDTKKIKRNLKPQQSADYSDKKDSLLENISIEKYVEPVSVASSFSHNDPESAPDTDDDSEMDGDFSSDADEYSEEESRLFSFKHAFVSKGSLDKKNPRYFWQYNMQAKGPKGPAMKLSEKTSNADNVKGIADPIFSPDCPIDGVKHSGKARRGDGNDLTPNPKKLHSIGKELEKLNSLIEGLVPVNELPVNARTKSRKEKNKLASRACRLKKKAQHEANKLKLFGLQEEQKNLLILTKEAKKLVSARVLNFKQSEPQPILATIESLQKKKAVAKVAGCSANFVNNVLKYVASGDESGGLSINPVHET